MIDYGVKASVIILDTLLLTFKVVNADDKIYQDNNGHYVLLDTLPDGETLTLSENSSLNQDGSIIYMEQESQDQP